MTNEVRVMKANPTSQGLLVKESALQAVISKMEEQPDYRPGWLLIDRTSLAELKRHLSDLREIMRSYGDTEGSD